ncbi:MAG: glycerophosphodiester phosphodiesterase [Verrucomicrobia bacterium]|nr:MAG: glycerophosphodiester phosphodiesterase [Verrucomicrobiota bacterium]
MDIIAHRGASQDAPENTLAAFNLGWKQNADAIELDIWLTKDGKIVCIHDDNTRRISGVSRKVTDQTLAELRALDAGKWKDPQWTGEKIPVLAEALATIPVGKRLFIEIKCGSEVLPELEHIINSSGQNPQQLAIISFSCNVAKQAKAKFPAVEVSWLYDWKKDKETGRKFTSDELIAKAKAANFDGLDLHFKGPIDAAFVRNVKNAGLKLYVWTVDEPGIATKLASVGVDGITTNRPAWLRRQLAA